MNLLLTSLIAIVRFVEGWLKYNIDLDLEYENRVVNHLIVDNSDDSDDDN